MNFQLIFAVAGAGGALAALLWVRRISKRVERLSQSYWELRYEHGQLNARVGRLEPADESAGNDPAQAPTSPKSNFVPLSSLRRSDL